MYGHRPWLANIPPFLWPFAVPLGSRFKRGIDPSRGFGISSSPLSCCCLELNRTQRRALMSATAYASLVRKQDSLSIRSGRVSAVAWLIGYNSEEFRWRVRYMPYEKVRSRRAL